jgi:hypothetical protein
MSRQLESVLERIEKESPGPCYLVAGDRVVAEPTAERLAEALGRKFGCEPVVHRRPARLLPLLDDLKTFSLFDPAKVIVAVESSVLADLTAAAALIDQAVAVLPVDPTVELSSRERDAAIHLLQAVRLFQLDPYQGAAEQVLAELPDWAFQGEGSLKKSGGRRRARSKKQVRQLREQSVALLEAAREAGLAGRAEGAAQAVGEILRGGLPDGHVLILAESSVSKDHPLVAAFQKRGALIAVGRVEAGRRGWEGLSSLTAELERETGVGIDGRAAAELARRTLRRQADRRGSRNEVDADSTARLAAEYRKLAEMTSGARIDLETVESVVQDRGEEDVWKILDEIGGGRAGSANSRLRRHLATSDDPMATRLSFFALLATYCRHLTAIDGALERAQLPRGERNFNRFKSAIAPGLQRDLPDEAKNPLAGLHPFRLHKAYLAASRLPKERVAGLPDRVLEVEMCLKGESRSPESALELLVAEIASG